MPDLLLILVIFTALFSNSTVGGIIGFVIGLDVYKRQGALLRNLDQLVSQQTGIPVLLAEEPLYAVALGTGKALENIELLKRVMAARSAR